MRGYAIESDVPYLTLLLATTALVHAVENVISIDLCPPYLPGCENTWTQAGAAVGDPCSAPCQANPDGTRWCPTGADHSGNIGTAWGWCEETAEKGEAAAKGMSGAEDDWTVAGAILGTIALYVVGGVAYNYKVKEEIKLPHVEFWKNVGGLVKDGVMWSKAKYNKEEYTAIPAPSPTVVHIEEDLVEAEEEHPESDEDLTDLRPAPPPRKAKKPKKKKKSKQAEAEPILVDDDDGGME